MNILPTSQINNLPILEEVLEELRLSVLDNIYLIADTLDLYSLSSDDLKKKLNLLGLVSITIGKFIKISLNDKEFEYISPSFYKSYRKLNRHRGNKMSMDYILHSGGMMNTLVHSNQTFYSGDIFSNAANFFEFSTYRDNQLTDLEVGDGYIIVPYSSNRSQILKQYLATNPIIFNFLPAGYTFVFLSEYRNGYNTGVLQFDNFLNLFNDTSDVEEAGFYPEIHDIVRNNHYWEDFDLGISSYIKPRYWENFGVWPDVEEVIILPDGSEFTINRTLYYYDPFLFRDKGIRANVIDYPRYTYDPTYDIPLYVDFPINRDLWPEWPDWSDETKYPSTYFNDNLQRYIEAYDKYLIQNSIYKWESGLESDLNNTLDYRDIWLGDYLLSTEKGANVFPEFYDHVKGLIAPQNASYSFASLYNRGESLASQYFQREEKVVSVLDHGIQINKKEIITDRKEMDLFRYEMISDQLIRLDAFYDENVLREILQTVFSFDNYIITNIINNFNTYGSAVLINGLDSDSTEAEQYFESIVNMMHTLENQYCNDIIVSVLNGVGTIIYTNDARYTTDPRFTRNIHVDMSENESGIISRTVQGVGIDITASSGGSGTETLYLGQTPVILEYIEL